MGVGSVNRRAVLIKEIETRGSVRVAEIARRVGVSEMTIRRDLIDFEKDGLVRRIYGGAVSARGRAFEPAFALRATEQVEAKRSIGARAAQYVGNGDVIALDVGTTTYEVARSLVGRRNLTVITATLHIANLLLSQPDIRVILPGGIVRPGEASLIGELAQRALQGLFVDRLFLGVGGLDAQAGLTEYNWDDALVKQAMIRSAKEVIVVADATKFGRVAFAAVAPLTVVHVLVTDQSPPASLLARLKEAGTIIDIAGEPQSNQEKVTDG